MIRLKVFTREDVDGGYDGTILNHLRPRAYMTSYSFNEMMKYAKEELEWAGIKEEDVVEFEIYNKEQHWTDYVSREGLN